MTKIKPIDYDIIYLSYDEPNAEKNYADLLTKVPWAKRVHGVEGSDAAHKACARLSETDRFITIDGDNIVLPEFLQEEINLSDDIDISKYVISWSGYNVVNGLTYGNGGIKCWPKDIVLNMKTHENADADNLQSQVDFCWDLEYLQISKTMSHVYNNATPWQAWRAGFREGVKMSLHEGVKLDNDTFKKRVHKKNFERLKIWQTVGMDVLNGSFAIMGARAGCYLTNCTDWDYVNVRDFEYLNNLWKEEYEGYDEKLCEQKIWELGNKLTQKLEIDIPIKPYDSQQSKFFKSVYKNPERVPQNFIQDAISEYDIVMITYNEPNGEANYRALRKRFPRAKRVHGIKGIHQAHIEAAKQCTTDMIWIVDGDAVISDKFNFDYVTPDSEKDFVKVWRSKNPVNDLEYGYGGIKLFPRVRTELMDVSKPDMTTSISRHFKPMPYVSNVTAFNTDEFSTWRSAFRECTKLASKVIDRQKSGETEERLKVWTTIGEDRQFGKYALTGAKAGAEYGLSNKGNINALKKINDFDWLREKFSETTTDISPQTNSKEVPSPQPVQKKLQHNLDSEIVNIIDRFEILYGGDLEHIRRFYNDNDLSSIFKLTDDEELRKAVIEKNLHSIFRLVETDEELRKAIVEKNIHSIMRVTNAEENIRKAIVEKNIHSIMRVTDAEEDIRKAVTEKNIHSIMRVTEADEDLRKAVTEENLHSIFRIVDADEDLRKAVTEENLYSIFRMIDADEDLRKAVTEENLYSLRRLLPSLENVFKILDNDKNTLWKVLDEYTNSSYINSFKTLDRENINYDSDCFSRGQVESKLWLAEKLKELNLKLGTVYICAGWYATIVPLLQERNVEFDCIRSFDLDPDVWKIAEIFNKSLVLDNWKFKAQTKDIFDINYKRHIYDTTKNNGQTEELKDSPNTIINTSCEHINNFTEWYDKIPNGKLVILQSNNFFEVDEHVNCVTSVEELVEKAPMTDILYSGELELPQYKRFMLIGYK